jgi:membrane protease YdiL (CAAX protease family)
MAGVWTGLNASAFLAGLGERDREPARLIGALVGGLVVAVVAAVASWLLIMVAFTLLSGQGGAGLAGLGHATQALVDPAETGLTVTVARLAVTSLVDGGFLLVFAAFAAAVGREPLHRSITAAPRVRLKLLIVGIGLAGIALAPIIVAERVFGGESTLPILAVSPSWGGRALYGAASLLLIPAAAAEELVFRGWLLRRVAAFAPPPGILVVLTAILFAAAHFDFNPDAFLTRALMGAGFAYMTLRLGGIEFSAGVHATNNMLIILFLEPLNLQAEHPTLSAFSLLEDITLLVGYFLITEAVVHIPWLRQLSGVKRDELSPPDNIKIRGRYT